MDRLCPRHCVVLLMLLAVALLASNASATAMRHPSIIGGHNSVKGDWPFMAALIQKSFLTSGQTSFCGGSYIGGRWVLTAAHCVVDENGRKILPGSIEVNIGSGDLATDRDNVIDVKKIWVDPSFKISPLTNDIALLELHRQPVDVHPVAILSAMELEQAALSYWPAIVLGRGSRSHYQLSEQPNIRERPRTELFEADVQLAPEGACNDIFNSIKATNDIPDSVLKIDPVNGTMLCAGNPSGATDTCLGDSGGPLLVQYGDKYYLAGITSWGFGCGIPGLYSVYTKVPAYLSKIEEVTDLSLVGTDSNIPGGKGYLLSTMDSEDSGGGAPGLWLIVLLGLLYILKKSYPDRQKTPPHKCTSAFYHSPIRIFYRMPRSIDRENHEEV